jgi:hypothetical protein
VFPQECGKVRKLHQELGSELCQHAPEAGRVSVRALLSNGPTDRLVLSTVTATIQAPIEKVDIADWLFYLPDAEYQRCSPARIAAGTTTTDDGRPMSINVETIGDALIIEHYVAEVREPHLCQMVSISDFIMASGRTKVRVEWELSVKPIDRGHCEYSNLVRAAATDEFLDRF